MIISVHNVIKDIVVLSCNNLILSLYFKENHYVNSRVRTKTLVQGQCDILDTILTKSTYPNLRNFAWVVLWWMSIATLKHRWWVRIELPMSGTSRCWDPLQLAKPLYNASCYLHLTGVKTLLSNQQSCNRGLDHIPALLACSDKLSHTKLRTLSSLYNR